MNASFLLNLYPAAWRARYEREFRAMLAQHPASAMDALDILLGAIDAHMRPTHQPGSEAPPVAGRNTRSAGREAIFFAHLSLFVVIIMVLAIINVATTAGNWWVLYPAWAWGTIVAVHGGLTFRWKGLLGADLAFYIGLNAGLITINLVQGGGIWFFWPMLTLGVLLVSHVLIAFGRLSLIRAHLVATVLGLALLLATLILTGSFDGAAILTTAIVLGILLAAHWLMRHRHWNLLQAHAFLYASILLTLLVRNLADDGDALWVQYPFAVWTILLAGHALLRFRLASWHGSDWEAFMLEELGSRDQPDTQRRLLGTLGLHVYLFLLATVALVVLNVITGTGTLWAAWPIGAWYVLLAFHAGYVLSPRRLLGSLLFGWVAISAGLIGIDLYTGGAAWWFWPVMWSAVVIAIVVGWLTGTHRRLFRVHLLGGIALAFALIVTDLVTGPPLWWFYPVAAIVITWMIHFGLTLDVTRLINPISGDR